MNHYVVPAVALTGKPQQELVSSLAGPSATATVQPAAALAWQQRLSRHMLQQPVSQAYNHQAWQMAVLTVRQAWQL